MLWNSMWSGPDWLAMSLIMFVGFGGLVLLVALALGEGSTPRQPATDERQVLDARLARGEIDLSEYLERNNALSEARHG